VLAVEPLTAPTVCSWIPGLLAADGPPPA